LGFAGDCGVAGVGRVAVETSRPQIELSGSL
jgi:hypothetical protein